jgi:hypothetical protein
MTANAHQADCRLLSGPRAAVVPSEVDATVDAGSTWDRADWQRMWVRTRSVEWRTLALVPAEDHTSTLGVANLIACLALDHGEQVRVADMRALMPKHVDALLMGIRPEVNDGSRVIFAARSASTSAATVPIARAADCAILCVSLGSTSMASIRDTIEQIGRKHFLGSLIVRSSSSQPGPAGRSSSRRSTEDIV